MDISHKANKSESFISNFSLENIIFKKTGEAINRMFKKSLDTIELLVLLNKR